MLRRIATLRPRVFRRGRSNVASFIEFTVVDKDNNTYNIKAKEGDKLLEPCLEAGVPIEAACDGECCCSTCHCYIPQEVFDQLEEPGEDELDMLDLAIEVRDNSRLACQTPIVKEFHGKTIHLPRAVSNLQGE